MKKNLALLILLVFAISCSDKPESGPVEIYYGEDICERCKMIISEREFAAQYRLSNGETVKFDDIGCMIHYFHIENPVDSDSIYVTDYRSGNWINAKEAHFLWSDNIITPMHYGVLSIKDKRMAQELAEAKQGEYLGGLNMASEFILKNVKANPK